MTDFDKIGIIIYSIGFSVWLNSVQFQWTIFCILPLCQILTAPTEVKYPCITHFQLLHSYLTLTTVETMEKSKERKMKRNIEMLYFILNQFNLDLKQQRKESIVSCFSSEKLQNKRITFYITEEPFYLL